MEMLLLVTVEVVAHSPTSVLNNATPFQWVDYVITKFAPGVDALIRIATQKIFDQRQKPRTSFGLCKFMI